MSPIVEILAIFYLGAWLIQLWRTSGKDSTDKSGSERSGLTLYVDHGTGVEYVGTPFGGLTVRVNANGDPMIRKEK